MNSCCDAPTGGEPFLLCPGDAGLLPGRPRSCFCVRKTHFRADFGGCFQSPLGRQGELGAFWKQPGCDSGKTAVGFNAVVVVDKTQLWCFSWLLHPVSMVISLRSWDFDPTSSPIEACKDVFEGRQLTWTFQPAVARIRDLTGPDGAAHISLTGFFHLLV